MINRYLNEKFQYDGLLFTVEKRNKYTNCKGCYFLGKCLSTCRITLNCANNGMFLIFKKI